MAKTGYIGVGNVARKASGLYVGVNDVARKVTKAYVGDANGKARLWFDQSGITLDKIPEGTIVKIKENNVPTEFYVAKHDYESALNGAGRILLVRKDCYDRREWHSSNVNAYASSTIDTWLNGDYFNTLDAIAQGLIPTTKFYYTPGNGTTTVTTLTRKVFLLSHTEYGRTSDPNKIEGTELSISDTLEIAYLDGTAVSHWTRSPNVNAKTGVYYLYTSGTLRSGNASNLNYSRPCFTLPSTAKFDKNYNLIG